MISCTEIKSHLTQLQDHELANEYRWKVLDHLNQCPFCSKEARELDMTWSLLDEYQGMEPSADFRERFWKAAQREPGPRPFFARWAALLSDRNWKLAAVGAAMMAMLAVGYGIFPNIQKERDSFDNQLLQEVNRLVNTDFDEPLSLSDEGANIKSEKSEKLRHKTFNKE